MKTRAWLAVYVAKLDGAVGTCPECGAEPVDWKRIGNPETRIGFVLLWCRACMKGVRLSRVRHPDTAEIASFDDEDALRGVPDFQIVDVG